MTHATWSSPSKIYNVGHSALFDFFNRPVEIEEKIDGSYFAFGFYPDDPEGELKVRSKGAVFPIDAPPAMFRLACETVKRLHAENRLRSHVSYRGEVLAKPKHNTLAYDRVPVGNIILHDIVAYGAEHYMDHYAKMREGEALGLEVVPLLDYVTLESAADLRQYLDRTSILGGQKIEGVVCKRVALDRRFGTDGKALMAKFVSESFKEVHRKEWKDTNPTQNDIIERIVAKYATKPRWNKAIQHCIEDGRATGDSPRDIGAIIKEIPADIWAECHNEIMVDVMVWLRSHVDRGFTRGFPEYYKQRLLEQQFEPGTDIAKE